MDWRNLVIKRLRDLQQWATWTVFAELWYLWDGLDSDAKTHFDLRAGEFLKDLPEDNPAGDKEIFIDTLHSCSNKEFVETLARATYWMNFHLSQGQLNAQLREITPVSVQEYEDLLFLIRQRQLDSDVVAFRQRTRPTAVLYRCWHVIPARTASKLSVNVKWLGDGPPPVWEQAPSLCEDKRAPPLRLPIGYENPAVYQIWRATNSRRMREHGAVEVRLTALIAGADPRVERIKELQTSFEGKDALICFPELSLDSNTHKRIAAAVKRKPSEVIDTKSVSLICPGTCHVEDDDDRWWNEAAIYDLNTGLRALSQRKVLPFKDTSRGRREVHEAISYGKSIEVLATSVGLVAVLICRDFVDSDAGLMQQCKGLDVDIVLVPSMGRASTFSACKRAAENYSRTHPFSVVFAMQTPPDMKSGQWVCSDGQVVCKVFEPRQKPKRRGGARARGVS